MLIIYVYCELLVSGNAHAHITGAYAVLAAHEYVPVQNLAYLLAYALVQHSVAIAAKCVTLRPVGVKRGVMYEKEYGNYNCRRNGCRYDNWYTFCALFHDFRFILGKIISCAIDFISCSNGKYKELLVVS